ncbi:hypothetical protein [Rubinisphaera sp.]|uniref:hypothetical protein n=1 Tax=Rubinisphaera sp. TaxID=2024857 RepID=UPI000C11D2E4|nr:hypothetical protein [Rubinisphaera sp.]MBV09194.1 hypothetical protein [Rubinisphaera sp.]HCS53751.1 hypothetical protein [Planctomycetaceae bacterium]
MNLFRSNILTSLNITKSGAIDQYEFTANTVSSSYCQKNISSRARYHSAHSAHPGDPHLAGQSAL